MPTVDELLAQVGSSDRNARIKAEVDKGRSLPSACTMIDGEIQAEMHAMLRAMLMMFGRTTGTVSDAEATHNLR